MVDNSFCADCGHRREEHYENQGICQACIEEGDNPVCCLFIYDERLDLASLRLASESISEVLSMPEYGKALGDRPSLVVRQK